MARKWVLFGRMTFPFLHVSSYLSISQLAPKSTSYISLSILITSCVMRQTATGMKWRSTPPRQIYYLWNGSYEILTCLHYTYIRFTLFPWHFELELHFFLSIQPCGASSKNSIHDLVVALSHSDAQLHFYFVFFFSLLLSLRSKQQTVPLYYGAHADTSQRAVKLVERCLGALASIRLPLYRHRDWMGSCWRSHTTTQCPREHGHNLSQNPQNTCEPVGQTPQWQKSTA